MDYKKLLIRIIASFFLISFFIIIIYANSFYLKYVILLVYSIILIEIIYNFKEKKIIAIVYLSASFLFIENFIIYNYSFDKFILFILITLFFDTYSYLFGSTLGKNKIIPLISPNKTYEGLFFGYIFTIFTLFLILFTYDYKFSIKLILIINLIIIFSFCGDLFESYLKRKSNIKDSGKLIPGHGGFFDRFDSFVMTSFLLPFWNFL